MAELFGTKRPAITKHLANIFKFGELDEKSKRCVPAFMARLKNKGCVIWRFLAYIYWEN